MGLTPDSSSGANRQVAILPPEGVEWMVPEITPEERDHLLAKLKPLRRDEVGNIRLVGTHDLIADSFNWTEQLNEAVDGLVVVAHITTYHTCPEDISEFAPTAAEVVAQIPGRFLLNGIWGFETVLPPYESPSEVLSPKQMFHRGVTTLYKTGPQGASLREVDDLKVAEEARNLRLEWIQKFEPPRAAEMDSRFAATEMVLLGDQISKVELWHQMHEVMQMDWDEEPVCGSAVIGFRDVMPIELHFCWSRIGGRSVMFVECISEIEDRDLIDRWLQENCSPINDEKTRAIADISDFVREYFVVEQPPQANPAPNVIKLGQLEIPKNIKLALDSTFYVVSASPFVRAALKERYGSEGEFQWEEDRTPLRVEVGQFDGETVEIEINWVWIDERRVAFIHPVSNLISYELITNWLDSNCSPKDSKGEIARVSAENFDQCLEEIDQGGAF